MLYSCLSGKIKEKARKGKRIRGNKEVIKRIMQLEKQYQSNLPLVIAEYKNGEKVTYEGAPPIEELTSGNIVDLSGSEFAELLNAIIHPAPNRNFEDFEPKQEPESEPDPEPIKKIERPKVFRM